MSASVGVAGLAVDGLCARVHRHDPLADRLQEPGHAVRRPEGVVESPTTAQVCVLGQQAPVSSVRVGVRALMVPRKWPSHAGPRLARMSSRVLTAVAWPYANGPRHIGHVSGFGVPSDVFSRYMRMAGDGC